MMRQPQAGAYDAWQEPSHYGNMADAVFDVDINVCGQPSVIPAYIWETGDPHYSLPYLAYSQRPLQPNDINTYYAPFVPHSGSVSEPQTSGAGGKHHNNSDIGYVQLKAPKF